MLGLWNVTAISPQALTNTHMSDALRGKKANLVNDLSIESMKDPAAWKQITGEDPILFNPKFKNTELGYITCPNGYAVNRIPTSWDRTGAVAVRRYIIRTKGTIPRPERNPQLAPQLAKNVAGIFNWAYIGYHQLTNAGWQWPISHAQQAQQDKAVLLENPIRLWAEENTLAAPGHFLKTSEAINNHIEWLITTRRLDRPEDRHIGDGKTEPGQPRLNQHARNRILEDLDDLWGERIRRNTGWGWPNRQITTYTPTDQPPQPAATPTLTPDHPEYGQY